VFNRGQKEVSLEMPTLEKSEAIENARSLVLAIAQALVNEQARVQVETISDSTGVTLRLTVAQGDIGKVIGKEGRTARSIRTILSAASMKAQERMTLDIRET
jgi:predicted RNA-binding protein YlqC (UPF0109 family)